MEKTQEQFISFLKEAFCIDGEVKYVGENLLINEKTLVSEKVATFELTDSKRGVFKVSFNAPDKTKTIKSY